MVDGLMDKRSLWRSTMLYFAFRLSLFTIFFPSLQTIWESRFLYKKNLFNGRNQIIKNNREIKKTNEPDIR